MNKPKKHKTNYIYSTISVALALFLLGLFALIAFHTRGLSRYLKESIIFTAELNSDASNEEVQQVVAYLKAEPNIIRESIRQVSANEALEELKTDFADLSTLIDSNVLSNSIEFRVVAQASTPSVLGTGEPGDRSGILGKTASFGAVKGVYYNQMMIDRATQNLTNIGLIFMGLAIFVLIVTILLIDTAVKLALYANRFLIRTMQLVGATPDFIMKPYLRKGLWQGIAGGLLAAAGLFGLSIALMNYDPMLFASLGWGKIAVVASLVVILGVAICFVSHMFGIRKYMKMDLDRLYG